MSADRHRGIRREKQKRAKDAKREHRQQYSPAATLGSTPASTPHTPAGAAAAQPAG